MPDVALEVTQDDIAYLRHGATPQLMRLFRPIGAGPFPVVIDLHGGAWTDGDRISCTMRGEILARAGIASAAIDFRQGPEGYLASMADINYALRWIKSNAQSLNVDPGRVGITGASSGGHLAMLAAMRPKDARYGAIKLVGNAPLDAAVRAVGLVAPVINPLSRYRRAVKAMQSPNPPKWAPHIPPKHDAYWKTEDAMAEGSPTLILERGEKVETPPAIYIQGRPDEAHLYADPENRAGDASEPERFVRLYRAAGGTIDLVYVETGEKQSPDLYHPLADFFREAL